jgi:tetratricopeptide (TPR) repeat protein
MKPRFLTTLIVISLANVLFAQSKSEVNKNIWLQAESYYLYNEYELANPMYLMLDELNKGNANIKYKIGNCYLNIGDEKLKSIPFLESAVKNASYNAKGDLLTETRAPLDAYFSLATAYRIANKLDSAIMTYQMFQRLISENGEMLNQQFVDQQIQACNIAKEAIKNPVSVTLTPLPVLINHGSVNDYPVVSFDGNTMAYTERRGIESAVFVTKKSGSEWLEPRDITAEAGCGTDCLTSCLNNDGTELYLYKNDNYDGNIYMTRLVNGKWGLITKLNKNINTKYYESHASISSDGKRLFFTSNREGTLGQLDIWVSEKQSNGDWGPAINLGEPINSQYNEETPFISADNKVLTFSSEGHGSMGGYDIFFSRNNGAGWGKPINIGYPINTTDDDIAYQPVLNGAAAYYPKYTGYKKKDINYVSFLNIPIPEAEETATTDNNNVQVEDLPNTIIDDTTKIITNLVVKDVAENEIVAADDSVLYYTVQVMALHKPVDRAFFKKAKITVLFNDKDKYYRYTTGRFTTKEEAYAERDRLVKTGAYRSDIFVKKVYKE